jgi:hypothetical protein
VSDIVQEGAGWTLQPAVCDSNTEGRVAGEGSVWPALVHLIYDIIQRDGFIIMQDGAGFMYSICIYIVSDVVHEA